MKNRNKVWYYIKIKSIVISCYFMHPFWWFCCFHVQWVFVLIAWHIIEQKSDFLFWCTNFICRDSSVGRALDWRSKGPRFDPGSRHCFSRKLKILFCYLAYHLETRYSPTYKIFSKCLVAQRGARTHDPEIKSLMLYRLS